MPGKFDPYRTAIFFIAGVLAFCLSVIVGIFAILPDYAKWKDAPFAHMVGGVLAWISIAALSATICGGILQIMKRNYFADIDAGETGVKPTNEAISFLMVVPILPGAFAVSDCVRGGAVMLTNSSSFPSLLDAIFKLI